MESKPLANITVFHPTAVDVAIGSWNIARCSHEESKVALAKAKTMRDMINTGAEAWKDAAVREAAERGPLRGGGMKGDSTDLVVGDDVEKYNQVSARARIKRIKSGLKIALKYVSKDDSRTYADGLKMAMQIVEESVK